MDGSSRGREQLNRLQGSRQPLNPKQRPHPTLRRNAAVIAPGRSMSVTSSAQKRCGLDIAFYGRGQSDEGAATPGQESPNSPSPVGAEGSSFPVTKSRHHGKHFHQPPLPH